MIFRCTKLFVPLLTGLLATGLLVACSSSTSTSSSGTDGGVTKVSMYATPSPTSAPEITADGKTFTTDLGDSITINKAYLVIWSTTIETSCDDSFSARVKEFLPNPLDIIVPPVHAHTTPTPTSTGEPHVIDLLAQDNTPVAIGSMSPSVADYCGVDVDFIAADEDALDLPGDMDMVGRTVYIEASFQQTGANGGMSDDFVIDTGVTLINRKLLLSSLMMISAASPTASVTIGINYDRWFDSINLVQLEAETDAGTDHMDDQVSRLLQNITASLHHI